MNPRLVATAGTCPQLLAENWLARIGTIIVIRQVECPTFAIPGVVLLPWLGSHFRPGRSLDSLYHPADLFVVFIINVIDAEVQRIVGIRHNACLTWR
jgi:hypothetical protein